MLRIAKVLAMLLAVCAVEQTSILAAEFIRADANADSSVDISDTVFVLLALFDGRFSGAQCQDSLDVNDDGLLDITDALVCLTFLFQGGGEPPSPFPLCGEDPTEDELGCEAYFPCTRGISYNARLFSVVSTLLDADVLASLTEEDRLRLAEDGVILHEDARILESPTVEFPGRWLRVNDVLYMTDLDGMITIDGLPPGLTELHNVPVFWHLGDVQPFTVLPILHLSSVAEPVVPSILSFEYKLPESMDEGNSGLGGGAGAVCIRRGCNPHDVPTNCCLDYDGIGDGTDLRRDDPTLSCQLRAYMSFIGSTCYDWTFAQNGKKTRACLPEGAVSGFFGEQGPICFDNHKYRYCQVLNESAFGIASSAAIAFGGNHEFTVTNSTPANTTLLTLDPPRGTLELAPTGELATSSLGGAGGSYVLHHYSDTNRLHGDVVRLVYYAPAQETAREEQVRVIARSSGYTSVITITMREAISVALQGSSPGATRITFTDGSHQDINWNLAVDFALDGVFSIATPDIIRYQLTRKRGAVHFTGTIDDFPSPGMVNHLDFDHNRQLDLQSANGVLDLDAETEEILRVFFTVETVNGRSFYPQHVRYELDSIEEVIGVLMTIDFPADIIPYEHEFAFGRRF